MTEHQFDDSTENEGRFAAFGVSRRDVMRATGASILAGGALSGVASAQGSTCRDEPALENCTFKHKYEENSLDTGLACDCSPTADPSGCISFTNGERCISITTSALDFFDASHVTLKTGRFCQAIPVSEGTLETLSLSCGTVEVRTFCSGETADGKIHDVSHVEIFGCPTADATVDCPNDRAVVDVANTDSVYWTVDYERCDASDKDGTQTFPDDSGGGFTVPLANCEGVVSVFTAPDGELLDSVHFDCETASVAVDCPNDVATISAVDTDVIWYEIDYEHCDEADVSRTMVDLSTTDSVTVPVANCEGTITLTDDDGRVLATADFDCETAGVSVDCPSSTATISASDTDEVWYEIDYQHCDAADVPRIMVDLSTTDSVTVPVANCEGTITLTDDDMTVLASADFDCETASVAEVDCPNDVARIHAEDTSTVNFAVVYDHCDAPDASGTLDFSATDDLTIPLANCEGTITLTDDDGRVLDTADFDCETASVAVDCPNDVATISAADTDEVWYEIGYDHCDVADVPPTRVDLGGDVDSATVPVANCEGTITLTDDDGIVLDSAAFDCETAGVSVECPPGTGHPVATISAVDTSTVDFGVDYDGDCADTTGSVDLSGSTDTVELALQNCDGTITVTDDDGRVLDSAAFERCCPPCPDALSVKFEENDIKVGSTESQSIDGTTYTFEITAVGTNADGEATDVCFASNVDFCELEVAIQAGGGPEHDKFVTIAPDANGEYCFDTDDLDRAISHFTISCP